jgi:phage anti-repressor protein
VPAVLAHRKQVPSVSARAIWEWLGMPSGDFRWWFRNAVRRQKLIVGKDFVCCEKITTAKTGRGGRNKKDYLLTVRAGMQVCASDSSVKGRALLKQLIDVTERLEAGDPEFAAYVLQRVADVHGEDHGPTPLSWRISKSPEKHLLLINVRWPGGFTMLSALRDYLLIMEDEVLAHYLPSKRNDLPEARSPPCGPTTVTTCSAGPSRSPGAAGSTGRQAHRRSTPRLDGDGSPCRDGS